MTESARLSALQTLRACGVSGSIPEAVLAIRTLTDADRAAILAIYPRVHTLRLMAEKAVRLHENTTVASRVADRQFADMARRSK